MSPALNSFKMKLMLRTFILCLATTALFIAAAPLAKADGAISPSIGVSPILIRRDVVPGMPQDVKITLTNYGSDPIPLGIVKTTITNISDDGSPVFSNQTGPQSATDWLSLGATDLILAPDASQDVTITVTPPKDTAPGGYNAAIQFQAKLPSYYFDLDANARVLPALSVSILLTVDSSTAATVKDLSINKFITPSVVLSSPISLVSEVNNPTSFFIFTDGTLTIHPMFGSQKTVASLDNSLVLPASTRKFIEAYTGSILPGIYTATIQLNQGGKMITATTRFVAIPWQFLLIFSVLFVAFTVFVGRQRFGKAFKVLFEKPTSR